MAHRFTFQGINGRVPHLRIDMYGDSNRGDSALQEFATIPLSWSRADTLAYCAALLGQSECKHYPGGFIEVVDAFRSLRARVDELTSPDEVDTLIVHGDKIEVVTTLSAPIMLDIGRKPGQLLVNADTLISVEHGFIDPRLDILNGGIVHDGVRLILTFSGTAAEEKLWSAVIKEADWPQERLVPLFDQLNAHMRRVCDRQKGSKP